MSIAGRRAAIDPAMRTIGGADGLDRGPTAPEPAADRPRRRRHGRGSGTPFGGTLPVARGLPVRHIKGDMLTPTQCQTARADLQWTREKLAAEAGIALSAVIDFELEQKPVSAAEIAALTGALEAGRMRAP